MDELDMEEMELDEMHGDARVGCPDVDKWPTLWPAGRARRQLDPSRPQFSLPRRLEQAHEIINLPRWFLRTAYQLSISCRGVEGRLARRLADGARQTLGVFYDARRELTKGDLII